MVDVPLVRRLLEHRRSIFGFIYALLRDVEAAEEVFQDVSVAVLQEAARGTQVADFLPWAREIARLRVLDHLRRSSRLKALPASLSTSIAAAFERHEESREDAARRIRGLLDCVDALPDRQREIVELRYRDRKSVADVADVVRWQANAVKVALAKIRRALADCLRAKGAIEEPDAT